MSIRDAKCAVKHIMATSDPAVFELWFHKLLCLAHITEACKDYLNFSLYSMLCDGDRKTFEHYVTRDKYALFEYGRSKPVEYELLKSRIIDTLGLGHHELTDHPSSETRSTIRGFAEECVLWAREFQAVYGDDQTLQEYESKLKELMAEAEDPDSDVPDVPIN